MNPIAILSLINLVVTHSTTFHADDVFGVALMRILKPGVEVVRTVNKDYLDSIKPDVEAGRTLIFDLGAQHGMLTYDHHQSDDLKQYRPLEDGRWFDKEGHMKLIPYCGFGLLWKAFGSVLCPNPKAWARVDKTLVINIDKADNGVETNVLSSAIGQFNPTWKEGRNAENECFWQAEEFAEATLRRYIESANAAVEAEEYILNSEQLDNGKILIMQEHRPWEAFVATDMPKVLFCIYPGLRDPWNIQKAPDAPGSYDGRCKFPERWLGNPDKSLGMGFCHTNNFLATADTLEHAINIARIAIKEFEEA